jgi:multiple sugar transport system substrate-binding protein
MRPDVPRRTPTGWLLCWIALLGGCGERERAETLTFWAMGREGEVVAEMMPEFERRHAGLRVRVQQIPWSAAHEKLLTAFVGDAMPDVFQAGNTWLPEFVALKAVLPLDERVSASHGLDWADYFPGILDTNVIGGRLYALPWYVDTRLLFYRADLLAAVGYADPPRTWTQWVDAMTRIKARARPEQYAILLPIREWQPPIILALQLGAELLRDGDRFGNFTSPAFQRAFAFYVELFRRDLAPHAAEAQLANLYHDFAEAYFAFYITGPWNLGEFSRRLPPALQGKWATAPMPAPDGRYPGLSLAGGASLAIARGSRRADAAWELIEYLNEPAQQIRFYQLSGDLPASQRAWQDPLLRDHPHARAFWQQLQAVRSTPKIPEWERVAQAVVRQAERAVRGEATLEGALAALNAEVDDLLEKRRWLLARAGER